MPISRRIRTGRLACALTSLLCVVTSLLCVVSGAAHAQDEGAAGSVEHGLESAGAATQSGLERAGAATGRALQKAFEKTGEGIGTAIEKTGQGLKAAGDALSGDSTQPAAAAHEGELVETDLPPEGEGPARPATAEPDPASAPSAD